MHASNHIEEIKKELEENSGKYDICILLSHSGMKEDMELAGSITSFATGRYMLAGG